MFRALSTDLSLDDALDLAEIENVGRSWRDAAEANVADKAKRQAKARAIARKAGQR